MWMVRNRANEVLGRPIDSVAHTAAIAVRRTVGLAQRPSPAIEVRHQPDRHPGSAGNRHRPVLADRQRGLAEWCGRLSGRQLGSTLRYRAGGGPAGGTDADAVRSDRHGGTGVLLSTLEPLRCAFPFTVP